MNNLSMGPLAPKVKERIFKHVPAVNDSERIWVFRCGVLRCPEILGELWPNAFRVANGYVLNTKTVFIKTRRGASRNHYRREIIHCDSDEAADRVLERESESGEHNPQNWDYVTFLSGAARNNNYQLLNVPTDIALSEFPLTFVCGRCGRQTRIQGNESDKKDSLNKEIRALR